MHGRNGVACAQCHADLNPADEVRPCKPLTDSEIKVNCAVCHEAEVNDYDRGRHGRLHGAGDPNAPYCTDCHGVHDTREHEIPDNAPAVLTAQIRDSATYSRNVPMLCAKCHRKGAPAAVRYFGPEEEIVSHYNMSIHGKGLMQSGLTVTATCADCHTAHKELPAADPESSVNKQNIAATCGRCHESIAIDYWDGIHGKLVKRGDLDAPVCTTCHGEHGILSPSNMRSPVSAARLAEATCAPCHESEAFNERYGIPSGRLRSYVDSYHGLKRQAGNVTVANCASCHGSHLILPHTDPRSPIHPTKLQDTCGECHPAISKVLASEPIHATATGIRAGWPRFFAVLYMWLIGITIGSMLLHNLGHWIRHVRSCERSSTSFA